jgi:hypothetical protein
VTSHSGFKSSGSSTSFAFRVRRRTSSAIRPAVRHHYVRAESAWRPPIGVDESKGRARGHEFPPARG